MKGSLGDHQRLVHIEESILEIEAYISGVAMDDFLGNSMMRFASIKQLEIIGEAANYLSPELLNQAPQIPWGQIIALRNLLVHEYFGVDPKLIWQIITEDLPPLKQAIARLLSTLEES